jgi:phosphoribosylformylglycinamidine cyclo-ligase
LFETPTLFQIIQECSKTEDKEMYQVFNMGHRLEIYTDEKTAENIINISNKYQIKAQIIGRVENFEGKKLSIHHKEKVLEY